MPDRYTVSSTRLPEGDLSPTLLFHRWHAYDRYEREPEIDRKTGHQKRDRGELKWLEPFEQKEADLHLLRKVAEMAQKLGSLFANWHRRFTAACEALNAEPPRKATTLWRLVIGWGTNPAFETGLTLDHLLGFPFLPGSAVKGLLHRVAEQELLEDRDGAPAIPPAPETLPAEPPAELIVALCRCRRVRALFGSLHLRRGPEGSPEAPYDRLTAWRKLLSESSTEPWTEFRRQLLRLCSEAPAGGMVSCFDAVPDPKHFESPDPILTPDVLTPHKDNKPTPILFLAVRDGVTFEFRYRLSAWPSSEPRDLEERERAADLEGIDRETALQELKRWLDRGLMEMGLGGKTSAGYGYLLPESARLPLPTLLAEPPLPVEPKEVLSAPERYAREVLPDGMNESGTGDALDKALKHPDPAFQLAVVARLQKLFPPTLEKWRGIQRPTTRKRVQAIDRLLRGREEKQP